MATVVRACMPLPTRPAAAVASSSAAPSTDAQRRSRSSSSSARVLVLGGTGRVGGSTATALSNLRPDLNILIAGRNREKGESLASKLGEQSEFLQIDIRDGNMLEEALQDVDLVVHAAGPFQRENECIVLQAAIATKTAYIDVCDDMDYSWRAKGFHEQAKASGIPAITTAGIYPGVSNVMAAELVHAARSENAGTGGAGPTILTTSFLLLAEDVIAYNKGEEIKLKPYSGALSIDFGKGVRKKDVYLLSVGYATAAFVLAVLEGSTQPGVWFPEEPEGVAIESRKVLLERASQGTTIFVMNKPSWMIETDPKEVGLGIYV
uniref:Saccharopine dehydrogenase NADP binding domain-containing protein n=1 Tax=Oryza punctata TaxID=4537 RepID=A0A0E0MCA1_ORYPU